jgi:hypothetical protein
MQLIQIARELKPDVALPVAAEEPAEFDLELIAIRPWTGGTYVAEIRTETMQPKRFGVGEPFKSYRIISIDPQAGEVVVYSKEHDRNYTLRMPR